MEVLQIQERLTKLLYNFCANETKAVQVPFYKNIQLKKDYDPPPNIFLA